VKLVEAEPLAALVSENVEQGDYGSFDTATLQTPESGVKVLIRYPRIIFWIKSWFLSVLGKFTYKMISNQKSKSHPRK